MVAILESRTYIGRKGKYDIQSRLSIAYVRRLSIVCENNFRKYVARY